MLHALSEIEIAYSLSLSGLSTLDYHYNQLNVDLRPVHPTEPEYEIIKLSLQNTHASTHRSYKLQLLEVIEQQDLCVCVIVIQTRGDGKIGEFSYDKVDSKFFDMFQIFEAKRHGEDERYAPFKKFYNKRLLWHGSRLANFASILSQVRGHNFLHSIVFLI